MKTLFSRLLGVFSRRKSDDRLSEEIQTHLDLLTDRVLDGDRTACGLRKSSRT
jgi:hypothetical protein